ncbi:MAG TPA: ABC transporter ATP-binding protein [Coriobacteriia bacterium]
MADVAVEGLSVTYRGGSGDLTALAGVDLALSSGDAVAVIGPSGCGKSTLLLTMAGLIAPTAGSVIVAGEDVVRPRLRTALILQDFGLLPWKTALANAELGLAIRRHLSVERRRRAVDALERVGLGEFLKSYPAELSGGMRQRVALARALALDADLLLMDEPLSALDALTREDLQDLLLTLWRDRGHTAILVTHSIEEAVYLGRKVVVISPRPGRVACVVDNPGMGDPAYRDTETFYERCAHLRRLLAAEGALHAGDAARPADPGAFADACELGGDVTG